MFINDIALSHSSFVTIVTISTEIDRGSIMATVHSMSMTDCSSPQVKFVSLQNRTIYIDKSVDIDD